MTTKVIMPQMGESVAEGTILKWLVNEGDRIEKDQSIVEISTDKIDTEIPSPVSGVLTKILHAVDETVPVGSIIAEIREEARGTADEKTGEVKTPAMEPPSTVKSEGKAIQVEGEKRYSPLVKKLAREYGIDLQSVKGSGIGGRVTKEDLAVYTGGRKDKMVPLAAEGKRSLEDEKTREVMVPLTPARRIIAERMVQSIKTSPHVTTTFEVDMSEVAKYRETNREVVQKGQGVHLTYLPFIIMAAASALRENPRLNSSWSDNGIVIKKYINIGIAVSLEDSLIVPVIRNADTKNLIGLANESQSLAQKARDKKLKPEDVQDSTFAITNYGISGSLFGTPIIMPPHAGILGIGAIAKRPVIINDAIAIRHMAYISLSFDHRIIDGAQADKFLSGIKDFLEGWGTKSEKVHVTEAGFGGVW
ncbi:MAG: 2-oxo acid dehydrogenase subunit E2 [Nitrospirae bacterium]|nr:2-oxo acid dehydrogenase subunit E2 [Nitrospirota bacterium]